MRWIVPPVLAGLMLGCGGSAPSAGAQGPLAAADRDAPAWAREGDARDGKAALFVCQGDGKAEADALSTAGALCDDKICRLCGVEVETVLQAEESLSGTELKRQVVERCRLIRTSEPETVRKSVECAPGRCTAYLQVRWTDAQKAESCQRLEDGHFAGPEACQAAIEAFRAIDGYAADRFRARTRALDRAIADCADIDVRPTPLMGALDAKLREGMGRFNAEAADTPGWLKRSWLAPDPALWRAYEQDPKFVSRLRSLRGYVAHKALLMDVVEAAEPADLDTTAALERLARACEAVSPAPAYGTRHVQRLAAEALYDRWYTHRLAADRAGIAAVQRAIVQALPPEAIEPDEEMAMAQLFSVGGRLDEAEWAYLKRLRPGGPALRRGLEVQDHGSPATRLARFREALEGALAGAKPADRPRRLEHVLPADPPFVLAVEPGLPADLQAHLDWDFFKDLYQRRSWRLAPADEEALFLRMERALRTLPAGDAPARGAGRASPRRARCLALADDLKLLAQAGRDSNAFGPTVCTCLADELADEPLSLVNRHDLYRRALALGLPCVAP